MAGCPFNHILDFDCHEDGDKDDLSYSEYLQLKPLLSVTQPLSNVHDEHLFIIVHQVYELWFKQIIHEIDSVRTIFLQPNRQLDTTKTADKLASGKLLSRETNGCFASLLYMDERNMLTVNTRLGRITKILSVLVNQIMILETMSPLHFAGFRGQLKNSSGFQSCQFRVIENKLGVKKENRINYNKRNYSEVFKEEDEKRSLELSEEEPSLFDLIQAWLERTPGLQNDNFDFWNEFTKNCRKWFQDLKTEVDLESNPSKKQRLLDSYLKTQEEFEQVLSKEKYEALKTRGDRNFSWKALQGALMIYYYSEEVVFHEPFQMLSLLMDIDSLITKWRANHVLLVQRQLGTKTGTGGSSGYRYLRSTISDRYKVFLDLFNLSNYLIPSEYIPVLHVSTRQHLAAVHMPNFNHQLANDLHIK